MLDKLTEKIKKDRDKAAEICENIDAYVDSVEKIFSDKEKFIENSYSERMTADIGSLRKTIDDIRFKVFVSKKEVIKRARVLDFLLDDVDKKITDHNDEAAEHLIEKGYQIIGDVEGRRLDKQQMLSIVKPMRNHLVIAGAGSGKTTTIIGKVKYMLRTGTCKPEDILMLSFTNASATEMKQRVSDETGFNVEVSTFHKLGMNIIKSVNGVTPRITGISLRKFASECLQKYENDSAYIKLLCGFYIFNPKTSISEFKFSDQKEYDDYLKMNPPVTINEENVKSYGEMDIANFLMCNGIEYEYEKAYETDTRTEERAQYIPDFYLPKYGIYIEYFGIDENGNVPSYFRSRDGRSPSEEYREGMEWKRALHRENNTVMIECYAYERPGGTLLVELEKKLRANNVVIDPIPDTVVWNRIKEKHHGNIFAGLSELMATVISLIKSNDTTIESIKEVYKPDHQNRYTDILGILSPIYEDYNKELKKNDEIDFDDMINDASRMIRDGRYVNPYKYVIVDEYQDISKSRFTLLKEMRDSSDYDLFCVGDDWQSIYRFTGSDIDYIVNFSKYWGTSEYSKIETTYRFSDSLSNISGSFVMQNPSQIKKSLKSGYSSNCFDMGEIKGYTEEWAIRFMVDRLKELPQDSTVFFIGRYNFDGRLLSNCSEFECGYQVDTGIARVELPSRKDLKMQFITAHRSKGLQADYVFIINNKDRGMGFPSKIQDDPLVEFLLQSSDTYPYAEERRLFYVAMTRARIKTFLVTVERNESVFATELEQRYTNELKDERYTCPRCGGRLIKRNGKFGEFFGCSNFRKTGCGFTRSIEKRQQQDFNIEDEK
ncbi:MAG: UvrD-helicase domain-containing protein [Lachnospiraceae bacterium]|nr:UvrD-helicase domain-containing protein [Lachnospiraceae bacterium]